MGNTSRKYHYHVNIHFRGSGPVRRIGRRTSGYPGNHNLLDTFVFYQKSCSMVLSRTKLYADGEILSKANNSINTQIIKALLCYYAVSDDFPKVDSITIVRKKAGQPDYHYAECDNVLQPIDTTINRNLTCSLSVLDILLDETPKGQTLRIAMSYWIKGIASEDAYYKFEHLWRAFNRLFMYQGNDTKEFECMRIMRNFILDNPHHFTRSISLTNAYTRNELHSFRWVRMILNDYDTRKKTSALVQFIQRYHDSRIMKLFIEKLVCRDEFINEDAQLRAMVDSHIKSHIHARVDAELVTLIAIKYAYFVRNKLFHGETPDGTFKVRPNNIDLEFERLNSLLEVLVMELMESHHMLRN